ncbi:hypothetical protein NBRC116188_14270 [Oceaniserpentilla sp. 4NH20-0058]|uniref:hypothetical protein n=1 Tax=Oceaniserpentilla sp. 4NH20-0058 TaxID=3127660 RepID=UPI0031091A4E
MKKTGLLYVLFIYSISLNSQAQSASLDIKDKPASYSYFAIGNENINYKETISISGANFETDTTTDNLVLLSGGRTFVSPDLSFSINAISTLYPQHVTETWRLTNTFQGIEPHDLQTNQFTYSQVSTQFLLHYHPQAWWSLDLGATYSLGTFKRFSFNYLSVLSCNPSQTDCTGDNVVEETFGELIIQGGGSSYFSLTEDWQLHFTALVGIPVFSRIENTLYPELQFDSTAGWNTEIISSLSYHLNDDISLGLIYDFQYQFKDIQNIGTVYIPENERLAHRYGLLVNWAF